jgi:hypothetical protein
VWLIVLSDQLPVDALVSRYLTNKLIGHEALPERRTISSFLHAEVREHPVLARVSSGCPGLRGRFLTCYSPVRHSTIVPEGTAAFDLHVLSTPPAFVLSQDQTLRRDLDRTTLTGGEASIGAESRGVGSGIDPAPIGCLVLCCAVASPA